jgi:hypothetical protein
MISPASGGKKNMENGASWRVGRQANIIGILPERGFDLGMSELRPDFFASTCRSASCALTITQFNPLSPHGISFYPRAGGTGYKNGDEKL